jgi:hypothetical protein
MQQKATGALRPGIAAIALVLILGLHATVVGHVISRALDHDEAEHLRASEWMAAGKTLYRDFIENHTPFLYLILSRFAPTDLDFDALRQYVTNARLLSAVAGTAAALCVARLATQAAGSTLAAVPALAALLARGYTYDRSVIDARSEPFTLFLFWAGVVLIVREDANPRRRAVLAGAGAALICVAALWNPKWPLETAAIGVWYVARLWSVAERSWRNTALSLATAAAGPCIAIFVALRTAPLGSLLFFAYRYPLRYYSWFRSSPLVSRTFLFPNAFSYCSKWFGPLVATSGMALLIILLILEWPAIDVQRRRLALLLVAFVLAGALEIRFLYSYPRLWPQYFVMWAFSLAAVYGVIFSSATRRYTALRAAGIVLVTALFAANAFVDLRESIDLKHWDFKRAIMDNAGPGEGVWLEPSSCPFVSPAGSYYWYAFKDQVPFTLAYAQTDEGREWLPPLTEADLPPCRMLDAHRHGLRRGDVYVRFVDQSILLNLPQSQRCLATLESAGLAHRISNSPLFEVVRPPLRY